MALWPQPGTSITCACTSSARKARTRSTSEYGVNSPTTARTGTSEPIDDGGSSVASSTAQELQAARYGLFAAKRAITSVGSARMGNGSWSWHSDVRYEPSVARWKSAHVGRYPSQ